MEGGSRRSRICVSPTRRRLAALWDRDHAGLSPCSDASPRRSPAARAAPVSNAFAALVLVTPAPMAWRSIRPLRCDCAGSSCHYGPLLAEQSVRGNSLLSSVVRHRARGATPDGLRPGHPRASIHVVGRLGFGTRRPRFYAIRAAASLPLLSVVLVRAAGTAHASAVVSGGDGDVDVGLQPAPGSRSRRRVINSAPAGGGCSP